jgi:hypothetical protein
MQGRSWVSGKGPMLTPSKLLARRTKLAMTSGLFVSFGELDEMERYHSR